MWGGEPLVCGPTGSPHPAATGNSASTKATSFQALNRRSNRHHLAPHLFPYGHRHQQQTSPQTSGNRAVRPKGQTATTRCPGRPGAQRQLQLAGTDLQAMEETSQWPSASASQSDWCTSFDPSQAGLTTTALVGTGAGDGLCTTVQPQESTADPESGGRSATLHQSAHYLRPLSPSSIDGLSR